MNPDDLPENLGRAMPEPDRLTVEDHYTMAILTGLIARTVSGIGNPRQEPSQNEIASMAWKARAAAAFICSGFRATGWPLRVEG